MKLAADLPRPGHGLDDLGPEILGVRGQEADPLDPLDGRHLFQQVGELPSGIGVKIGIDVLSQQLSLQVSFPGQVPDLFEDRPQRPVFLPSAGVRHDAVGAEVVAPFHHRDVAAELAIPLDKAGRSLRPFL